MSEKHVKNMEAFAAISGVSRPTLSKYFNDPQSVRESTRLRIEQALKRHEYRPNFYAVNQNRRHTKNIGLVVPDLTDPFFAGIARVIEELIADSGYNPILFSSHRGQAQEIANLDNLRAIKPTGVLLAPLGRASDKQAIERFVLDVPTVLFDANLEGVGAAFFGSDNNQSIGLMVEYLCRTGSAPAFFEMQDPINPNAYKRRAAYVAAMERHDLAPKMIQIPGKGWAFEELGFQAGKDIIAQRGLPSDTILCSNDRLAIGLLSAAHESGIKVGLEGGCGLRIAGHDDHPFSRFTYPSLTTIAQDYAAIAKRSWTRLMDEVSNPPPTKEEKPIELFDGRLVMRGSA